jgi:hypothetical protein
MSQTEVSVILPLSVDIKSCDVAVVFSDEDFIPNSVNINESAGKLKAKGHTHTHTGRGDLVRLLSFM